MLPATSSGISKLQYYLILVSLCDTLLGHASTGTNCKSILRQDEHLDPCSFHLSEGVRSHVK